MELMEVEHQVKQTEVGPIPDDWDVSSVRDFGRITTGPFGTLLKASEYSVNNGVPLISVGEIRPGFIRVKDETPRIPEEVIRRLPKYVLRTGDIVFGRKGGVERSALVRQEQDGWFLGSDGLSIRLTKPWSAEFVAYQFQSSRVQGWLLQNAIGTTMASLNQEILNKLLIPVPPTVAEQEVIAEALSDADALIESLEQLIAKKRQIKQGAMQELLTGKRRLPGFDASALPQIQTEMGKVPADWPISTVGNEYTIQLGKMLDAEKNTGVNKPYLGNRALQWDSIDTSDLPLMAMSRSDMQRFRLHQGDLLVCEGGEVGRAAVWESPIEECYYQKALHRLRARRGYKSELMIAFLSKWSAEGRLLNYVTQTSIAHLPKEKFVTIPLPVPGPSEQIAIAQVLSEMNIEVTALESKLDKYRQIKQGMMHNLLTGKVRLI